MVFTHNTEGFRLETNAGTRTDVLACSFTLRDDGTFYYFENYAHKMEGNYIYSNDTLVLTNTQEWRKEEVIDSTTSESNYVWQEVTPDTTPCVYLIRFICNNEVMLRGQVYGEEEVEEFYPYVNVNATGMSNINDIQGKWCWMNYWDDNPRVIVNVDGDQCDVIIVPWGERYVGTISYDKGIIVMETPTYYTTRYGIESTEEHMNNADPESSEWRQPDEDDGYIYWEAAFNYLRFNFVVDGDVAYGGIANLPATFQRQ